MDTTPVRLLDLRKDKAFLADEMKVENINPDWEKRQKHASFYQALIGSVQQSATASFTSITVILTLGATMTKMSDVPKSQDWNILLASVVAWVAASAIMVISFSRAARRIETGYRREYDALFPGHEPYRLESFLLDFARLNPLLVKGADRGASRDG